MPVATAMDGVAAPAMDRIAATSIHIIDGVAAALQGNGLQVLERLTEHQHQLENQIIFL